MSKLTKDQILHTLPHFVGTDGYYKYMGGLMLTDGAKYVADSCGAFWLLDIIWSVQTIAKVKREAFQVYKLKVEDGVGVVTVEDGNKNVVYKQEIPYTDFPLDEITLWMTNKVIMLPSEY
jgi:hypothetical protein